LTVTVLVRAPVALTGMVIVPASMPRLAGLERAQLMVQSQSRSALQSFLHAWYAFLVGRAERRVRWALDIDPQEL